jgi:hypothetical protein
VKKITLLLLLVGMMWISMAQVTPKASDFSGNVKTPEIVSNSNRSIPQGTLVYSQIFFCPPPSGLASSTNYYYSYGPTETAEDFILASAANINIVRWWFFINDNPLTTNWIIRIYDNANCLPSNLITTYNLMASDISYEFVCTTFGLPVYDCWANLGSAFSAQAGVHYWISIQADGGYEWWCESNTYGYYVNCLGAFKSPFYGYDDFVPSNSYYALGYNADFSFELYTSEAPPSETPISNWAIGIGIFLILAAAVVRFRKII